MGKIIITSNLNWLHNLSGNFEGKFKESFLKTTEAYSVIAYHKLNIDNNENVYVEGDNFVAATGTLIYSGKFGMAALRQLYYDSESQTISEIRKKAIGSYCIAIKKDNRMVLFVDEAHTYSIYYYVTDDNYLITNTYYHIGKSISGKVNDYALLERGIRRCIMSNQTPIKDVYKLGAREAIEIDIERKKIRLVEIDLNDYHMKYTNKKDAVSDIKKKIMEVSNLRNRFIHSYLHFLTGGIDSRLEMAIHKQAQSQVSIGYWTGKDVITNGTVQDANIAREIADYYGFDFTLFDVSQSFEDSVEDIGSRADLLGEYASLYCGNTKWLDIFMKSKNFDSFGFGYLGESFRNLSNLDSSYKEPYGISNLVEDVYCRSGLEKKVVHLDGIYEFICNEFCDLLKIGENRHALSIDAAFRLFTYSRFDADCILNNFVNQFAYSIPIFGQKVIADAIYSLPYSWLQHDSFSLALTEEIEAKLLEFPIYSHHRYFDYDPQKGVMMEKLKYRVLDWLKPRIKDSFLYSKVYVKYAHKYIRPESLDNDKLLDMSKVIIKDAFMKLASEIEVVNADSWQGIDVSSFATFAVDSLVLSFMERR